jgi:hypothetical protein
LQDVGRDTETNFGEETRTFNDTRCKMKMFSENKKRLWNSPSTYVVVLLDTVVVGMFFSAIGEVRNIGMLSEKITFFGFNFIFLIYALNLSLFYTFLIIMTETDRADHLLSGSIGFIFISTYIICFLLLGRAFYTYLGALASLSVIHILSWLKYFRKIRQFEAKAIDQAGVSGLKEDSVEDLREFLKLNYRFYSNMLSNKHKLLEGSGIFFLFTGAFLIVPIITGQNSELTTNWLITILVAVISVYMASNIVYNLGRGLNPRDLEEYKKSGDNFCNDILSGTLKSKFKTFQDRH